MDGQNNSFWSCLEDIEEEMKEESCVTALNLINKLCCVILLLNNSVFICDFVVVDLFIHE